MKLVAVSSILALAASETLLDRARQSEILRNLLNVNLVENANGFDIETVYGDMNIQRNPPMATLVNGANTISAGRDDGLFVEFNVVNKADMNSNFLNYLEANNRCAFDTLNSRAELKASNKGMRFTHVGQTDNGLFSAEATVAVHTGKNARRISYSFKSSGASGVCDFDLNREASGFARAKRINDNYMFEVSSTMEGNTMSATVAYTPTRITVTGNANGAGFSKSVNAVDGTWMTTSAIEIDAVIGKITLPGPGNMATVQAAAANHFNWVVELAENGNVADSLAIILHAEKAANLLTDHLDLTSIISAVKLDFPLSQKDCDKFQITCGYATFQSAVPAIAQKINRTAVEAIQDITNDIAPEVRTRLQNAIDNGVPTWFIAAMA